MKSSTVVLMSTSPRLGDPALGRQRGLPQGPLQHSGWAVHTVSLPALKGDIEYNIRATTVDGTKLIWPATAPAVNHTVVVMP